MIIHEVGGCTIIQGENIEALRAIELEQQAAGLKSEWFHRGQESVRRKNESGCCCKIDDDDKILSACNAHAEWAGQQLAEKDREIAELRRGISLCAELAELKARAK